MASTTRIPHQQLSRPASWADLPRGLIQRVADAVAWSTYHEELPPIFEPGAYAPGYDMINVLFRALRSMRYLLAASLTCKNWRRAFDNIKFWSTVAAYVWPKYSLHYKYLEPRWTALGLPSRPEDHTGRHWEVVLRDTCLSCLLYHQTRPRETLAIPIHNKWIGTIRLCKKHHSDGACGRCLRDDTVIASEYTSICPVDETDEVFAGAGHSCEHCRWFEFSHRLQRARLAQNDIHLTDTLDTVKRYRYEGEGSPELIVNEIIERKWWLQNTKIRDYSAQANGAVKFADGATLNEVINSEDSYILYWDSTVQRLSMRDFVRTLIMRGQWHSPYEMWDIMNKNSRQSPMIQVRSPLTQGQVVIPMLYPLPPLSLLDALQTVWQEEFEAALEPPLKNIIASIEDRCLVERAVHNHDGTEPGAGECDLVDSLTRCDLNHVWISLNKIEYWVTGYDWRTSVMNEYRRRRLSNASSFQSSKSSCSAESDTASARHSTPLTTPSPPPPIEKKEGQSSDPSVELERHGGMNAPTTPDLPEIEPSCLDPKLCTNIPAIPLPRFLGRATVDSIKDLWQKVIGPIVQCQCSMCQRAHRVDEEMRLLKATGRRFPKLNPVEYRPRNEDVEEHDTNNPPTSSPHPRKRCSEEVESQPNSPTSAAKRRKLENGDAVDCRPSPDRHTDGGSVPPSDPGTETTLDTNPTVKQSLLGFEARKDGVGIGFADFVLDEDIDDDELDEEELYDDDDDEALDEEMTFGYQQNRYW